MIRKLWNSFYSWLYPRWSQSWTIYPVGYDYMYDKELIEGLKATTSLKFSEVRSLPEPGNGPHRLKENKMNGEELYTAYETEWEKFNTGVDKWCELTEIDRHVWNRVATRLNTNATPPSEPYQDCPLHFVA